jgi:hypothetical protein
MYALINLAIIILALIMPGGLFFLMIRARRKKISKKKIEVRRKSLDIKTLKKRQRIYLADKYRRLKEKEDSYE